MPIAGFAGFFSNLLRLAHLSQDDLKRFLYEIYESEFKQKSIDPESDYSSQFEKVKQLANEVRTLQAVAEDIRHSLLLAAERDVIRSHLPILFTHIVRTWEIISAELFDTREKLKHQIEQLNDKEKNTEDEYQETNQASKKLYEKLGVLKQRLEDFGRDKEKFQDYLLDFEKRRHR